ncbi:MAG: zinc ribbon domain-containing protein [Acidobacteria bacterium]|nr:zinc ribbon domain-containing protein [Acidobacteriota bacterium]
MPFYDYRCSSCDHTFEAFQSISEAPLETCPVCGELKLKKLVSAPAFSFKGGGWYKDLYSSAGSASTEKPSTTSTTDSASSSNDTSSDAKKTDSSKAASA